MTSWLNRQRGWCRWVVCAAGRLTRISRLKANRTVAGTRRRKPSPQHRAFMAVPKRAARGSAAAARVAAAAAGWRSGSTRDTG